MVKNIFFIVLLLISLTSFAQGRIYVDVGKASVKQSLVAFPPLQIFGNNKSLAAQKFGDKLYAVISNDLEVSGLFKFIDPAAFLEDVRTVGLKPAPGDPKGFSFSKWTPLNTEFLIRGGYYVLNNKATFEAYVYYVPQAKVVFGKKYSGPVDQVRAMAHTFSNDVVKSLTGKQSIFNTKIVASIDNGPRTHKEIYVMDWDSANKQQVTRHHSISISPTWSHDGNKIAYTSYIQHSPRNGPKVRNADLFVYDLKTKKRWLTSYRKGINSGACFLPDGKNMLLTISKSGNPDIYKMSNDGKKIKRITRGPNGAMNVEPAISPDGKKIAFSSSRSGKIMIYIMNIDGTGVKRITFAGRYNATPTWSPDGKMLAYAGYDNKKKAFDIFITDKNGYKITRLTSAKKKNGKWANNEDPTFSPDGRHIMFVSDRFGRKQLFVVNPDGRNERRITFDNYNYSKPKWSPM